MIFSFLSSLNIAFIAFIVNQLVGIATATNQASIISVLLMGIVGLLVFLGIGIIVEYLKHSYIRDINMILKTNLVSTYINSLPDKKTDNFSPTSFLTSDLKLLEKNGILAEITILQSIMTFIVAISSSIFVDFWTTLSFFLGTFLAAIISVVGQGKTERLSEKWSFHTTDLIKTIEDTFSSKMIIQIYDRSSYFIKRLKDKINAVDQSLLKLNFNIEFNNQLVYTFAMIFGIFIPFGVGIYRVTEGSLLLAGFIAVLQLSNSLVNPLLLIIQLLNEHSATKSIVKKHNEITQLNIYQKYRIEEFNIIRFYTTINNKSMEILINKGDKILIRGASGIGKSTILSGLLYNPGKNKYLIDDHIIQGDIVVQNLYSFVNQSGAIFNEKFVFNITLGKEFSLNEIEQVIAISGLTQFVSKYGMDYYIEKDGGNISGGEAQRIRIARALLQDNDILVLDEITSSLDTDSAYKIRKKILSTNKTIIEVAHHIDEASLKEYNKIIDLT